MLVKHIFKKSVFILSSLALLDMTPLPVLTKDASAQNLLQVLFNGPAARKKREEARLKKEAELAALNAKKLKISAPRYYTYRADKLALIDLSSIAASKGIDPMTTSATSAATSDMEMSDNPATTIANMSAEDIFANGLGYAGELELEALPEVAQAILKFYQNSPRFRWVDENGINERARALMAALSEADKSGLPSENYYVAPPNLYATASDDVRADARAAKWQELMRFEMSLSAAALSYVADAHRGLIDPNRISGYHDFTRKPANLDNAMIRIAYTANPRAVLNSYNPEGDHFKLMQAELSTLLDADDKERITIAEGTFLKPGATNPELRHIIASIRLKGSEQLKSDFAFTLNTYRGEEIYSDELVELVKAFQAENNLAADGIVGQKTIRALVEDSNALKIEKLKFAMERARWLPHKFADKHVFINQPAYNVTYFEAGAAHLSMRVVVGKKSNQTNFFSDEIEKVEFNPSWGVPQSIIANEMLPKLRADPTYLDRQGYQVTYKGQSTASGSVNWNMLSSTQSIGVRQPPGPKNALGELKILFPNAHAIYMHDTPAKKLFGRDTRAFSHGCVRLQHPREMAAAVLGSNMDEIAAHIAPRKNKTVFLDKPIPVHVAYFTAWPNAETGEMEYFDDVYGRDQALAKAFATTVETRVTAGS